MQDAFASSFATERATLDVEGVAWAVLIDGEIRYAGADGLADADSGREMAPTTLLRSGSTLKMQTAAVVLAQQAAGTLSLEDTVADHLPTFDLVQSPGILPEATLHQLLSHQGGISDTIRVDGPIGPDALYDGVHGLLAEEAWPMAPPGTFFNYSNPNFSLAALIAEEASGTPYADLVRETVWEPLCMDRTTLDDAVVEADGDFATAATVDYWSVPGAQEPVRVGPGSYGDGLSAPAGRAWSSVVEMLYFAHFLMDGDPEVLPDAQRESIPARHVDTLFGRDGRYAYGYGVSVSTVLDRPGSALEIEHWSHTGGLPGYTTDLHMFPDHGLAIAVLANGDGKLFTGSVSLVAESLAAPAEAESIPWEPLDPTTLVGTYLDPFVVGRLDVSWDGTTIGLYAPDLEAAGVGYVPSLEPGGGAVYTAFVDGSPLVVTFIADAAGTPTWIRHRHFVAKREAPTSSSLDPGPAPPGLSAFLRDLPSLRL